MSKEKDILTDEDIIGLCHIVKRHIKNMIDEAMIDEKEREKLLKLVCESTVLLEKLRSLLR